MRTALLYGPGDIRIHEVDVPKPALGEILVKVAFCGLCGTDLHAWRGTRGSASEAEPRNLGHEISGFVEDLGPAVDGLQVGDPVTVNPYIFCGRCFYCQNDFTAHCVDRKIYTKGWSEYMVAHASGVYPVPPGVSLAAATQAESLAACLQAVDAAGIRPGWTALVQGAGPMGLMTHALARGSGAAKTIVSEPSRFRRDMAAEMGADIVVDPAADDIAEVVRRETGGYGADVAFDCVTRSFTLAKSIASVHAGGTVVIVGNLPEEDTVFPVSPTEIKSRALTIHGSFSRGHTFERSLKWLQRVDMDQMITGQFPLERIGDAFGQLGDGAAGKLLIEFGAQ